MIRRSRISVRPNVKPTGRISATSRGDAPAENSQTAQTATDISHSAVDGAGGEEVRPAVPTEANNKTEIEKEDVLPQPQTSGPAGDSEAQSTTSSEANLASTSGPQRRKRFAVLPNLAKPRTTTAPTRTSSRTPKSPVKPSILVPEPEYTKDPAPGVKTTSDSRGKRRPSGAGKPKTVDPLHISLKTPATSLEEGHETSELNKSQSSKQDTEFSHAAEDVQSETAAIFENPPESLELWPAASEEETVVTQENKHASTEKSPSSPHKNKIHPPSLAQIPFTMRTLNDPLDRLRLAKAKKLRELLKKEMNKDKQNEKQNRPKMGIKERKTVKDHTKMTMRELIYYLPSTNPMKSYVEDEQRATETVLPASPKEVPAAETTVREDEEDEAEEERTGGGGDEEPLLAPRVKVAEDGSLIIDEESLTVEVLRVKGPNPAEERDPIFERGSTTTYSSFRKGTYTKPWSNRETDMFFLAISMVGTDFSMIGQLFPHRARIEIKNKFKKEERANSWRIDKAFKERRRLDLDFFNSLLEKILKDEEKKRKKKKDATKLPKVPRTPQRKSATVRKKKVCFSSGSEEESSGSDVMEGEKENEGISNDGGSSTTPVTPRRKSMKKNKAADLAEESIENGAAEGQSTADRLQKADSVVEKNESCLVNAAQLKGRAQKVAPNLEQRWTNKGSTMQKKAQNTNSLTGEDSSTVSTATVCESKTSDVISCGLEYSEEEDEPDLTAVQEHILNKPTRSGRIPKLSQHVIRAVAEEDDVEEQQPSSCPPPSESRSSFRKVRKKPGSSLKRGIPRRGKSRLVTLRALTSEEEEDEDDGGIAQEDEQYAEEEPNQAFVPLGLRSQPVVHTVVEETMEELDISMNVPDVLGISHNSLCSESSCERALGHGGSVPCEHQLDLLVDVIEFLAPEQMEVSEESYTEAAKTLLTIGHSAHLTSLEEAPCADDDVIIVEGPSSFGQQDIQQEVILEITDHSETGDETCQVVTPDLCVISEGRDGLDMASTVYNHHLEQTSSRSNAPETSVEESISSHETEILPSNSQSEASIIKASEQNAPPACRNRLLKPKPKLDRVSRSVKGQQKQTSPENVIHSVDNTSIMSTTASVNATGDQGVESNLLTEDSAPIPTVSSEPEPKKTSPDQGEPETGEKSDSVLSLEGKLESSVPEVNSGEQRPQQIHRRCRGPKPKPNLIQSARTTRTQQRTAQSTAVATEKQAAVKLSTETFSDTQRPQDGDKVVTKINLMSDETETLDNDSVKTVSSSSPEKLSGFVSKQDTTPAEKTRGVGEEIIERLVMEPPGTSEVISSDLLLDSEYSSAEPVFILSLTEVPSTLTETDECIAKSELQPEPLSASAANVEGPGPARDQVSHLLLPDVFVPVSEEQEEQKEMDVDEREETKQYSREKEKGNTQEGLRQISKRGHSLLIEENPAVERPSEQHAEPSCSSEAGEISDEKDNPAKRRKLPERGRRAKLQVKPNPVQRKALCSLPAKEISSLPLAEGISSTPASTQQQTAPLTVSLQDISSTSVSSEDFPLKPVSVKRTKSSPNAPKDTSNLPVLSPTPSVSLSQSVSHCPGASSQDIVGQEGLPVTKTMESVSVEGTDACISGEESQPVHQITPLATTGPLTRPGRRPRGFLSFMSSTSTQGPSSATRGATAGPVKLPVNTTRSERKRTTPGPLTSASRPVSASQRTSRDLTTPNTQPSTVTPAPAPQVSTESETSHPNPNTEDEPTGISAYFFSDIFTMVEEQEIESE